MRWRPGDGAWDGLDGLLCWCRRPADDAHDQRHSRGEPAAAVRSSVTWAAYGRRPSCVEGSHVDRASPVLATRVRCAQDPDAIEQSGVGSKWELEE
jgi:hypothetical protein